MSISRIAPLVLASVPNNLQTSTPKSQSSTQAQVSSYQKTTSKKKDSLVPFSGFLVAVFGGFAFRSRGFNTLLEQAKNRGVYINPIDVFKALAKLSHLAGQLSHQITPAFTPQKILDLLSENPAAQETLQRVVDLSKLHQAFQDPQFKALLTAPGPHGTGLYRIKEALKQSGLWTPEQIDRVAPWLLRFTDAEVNASSLSRVRFMPVVDQFLNYPGRNPEAPLPQPESKPAAAPQELPLTVDIFREVVEAILRDPEKAFEIMREHYNSATKGYLNGIIENLINTNPESPYLDMDYLRGMNRDRVWYSRIYQWLLGENLLSESTPVDQNTLKEILNSHSQALAAQGFTHFSAEDVEIIHKIHEAWSVADKSKRKESISKAIEKIAKKTELAHIMTYLKEKDRVQGWYSRLYQFLLDQNLLSESTPMDRDALKHVIAFHSTDLAAQSYTHVSVNGKETIQSFTNITADDLAILEEIHRSRNTASGKNDSLLNLEKLARQKRIDGEVFYLRTIDRGEGWYGKLYQLLLDRNLLSESVPVDQDTLKQILDSQSEALAASGFERLIDMDRAIIHKIHQTWSVAAKNVSTEGEDPISQVIQKLARADDVPEVPGYLSSDRSNFAEAINGVGYVLDRIYAPIQGRDSILRGHPGETNPAILLVRQLEKLVSYVLTSARIRLASFTLNEDKARVALEREISEAQKVVETIVEREFVLPYERLAKGVEGIVTLDALLLEARRLGNRVTRENLEALRQAGENHGETLSEANIRDYLNSSGGYDIREFADSFVRELQAHRSGTAILSQAVAKSAEVERRRVPRVKTGLLGGRK